MYHPPYHTTLLLSNQIHIYCPSLSLSPHLAFSVSIKFQLFSSGRVTMARFLAALILVLMLISMLHTMVIASHGHGGHHYNDKTKFGPGSLKSYECPSQCTRRCKKTQYHKACMFFCQKCCRKCLCVPPGYYGNKAVCPCYNNWKTKEGGPKCP